MFKRILLALDGSENAERALPWVKAYAGPDKAMVVLTRIVDNGVPLEEGAVDRWLAEARDYLQGAERELNFAGIPSKIVVDFGVPAELIVAVARREKADLVVMASRGGSKVARWLLGGTVGRVLRLSPVPVLVARSETPHAKQARVRRVLFPFDGSQLAELALPWAERLATAHHAKLVFLHVHPIGRKGRSDAYEQLFERIGRRVDYLRGVFRKRGVATEFLLRTGDPAEEILEACRGADLIAMATHGRGGVKRWIFGSVAEKVIHAATVPVFVHRGPVPETAVVRRARREAVGAGPPLW